MSVLEIFHSESVDDTVKIAEELAPRFKPNDVILLEGNLGSGKTFLVKEICKILNTEDEASSPSFAILYQYSGPVPVNHFDLYRIKDIRELDNLGWEEHLTRGAITFIEWPEILESQLIDFYKINITNNDKYREFILSLKTD
jgi:tRNA threonylcarbamoyladenosine biosynthesis protein TsaE